MAKYGMSMCALGWSLELAPRGIAANCLWPRTAIDTAAVRNLLGGDELARRSRTVEIMADAAHVILTSNSRELTGKFLIDEDVLRGAGVSDFTKYAVDPSLELAPDFFL
jgi:citronellol/citronellal dehydrogenase